MRKKDEYYSYFQITTNWRLVLNVKTEAKEKRMSSGY